MAADTQLAARVRALLTDQSPEEKTMFGGLAFLVNGHMTVAVDEYGLLLRIDPDAEWITADPRAGDAMPGRRMRNWRSFDVDANSDDLADLVAHALAQVLALPAKE